MRFVSRNRAGDPQIHSGFAIDKVAECAPAVGDKWKKERRRGAGAHERVGGGGGGEGVVMVVVVVYTSYFTPRPSPPHPKQDSSGPHAGEGMIYWSARCAFVCEFV